MNKEEIKKKLLNNLTKRQQDAVQSCARRELVVAGAGSGKTEVMARRIAWWVGIEDVSKDSIVALTFTEKAAEEMKFRVRKWIGEITPDGQDINLAGMYVGTIHGFCLEKIREYWPNTYHNFDILDEAAKHALVLRGYNNLLGLTSMRSAMEKGTQSACLDLFVKGYDQLHENNRFQVQLPEQAPPLRLGEAERDWCAQAELVTDVGDGALEHAFSRAASRYYAYLRCRRFLDFSTSQSEFLRNLSADPGVVEEIAEKDIHVVVDEVQDINPIQRDIIFSLLGDKGTLTAVGDHRQSIYGFRGAKVSILNDLWETFNKDAESEIVNLLENFRSTPRIIDIANDWAETINPSSSMETPAMKHGRRSRTDIDSSHISLIRFSERENEAEWIASAIDVLVPSSKEGAEHDESDEAYRGIARSDIAILVRGSKYINIYKRALEKRGISCVVKAGPDLFSQPEVLLLISAFAISSGVDEFWNTGGFDKSLPARIKSVLNCGPSPKDTLFAAADALSEKGLDINIAAVERTYNAAEAVRAKIVDGASTPKSDAKIFRSQELAAFVSGRNEVRRVFPQQIYHWFLTEIEADRWDKEDGLSQSVMFHLGTLSSYITGMETPGWTSVKDFKWQVIGLLQYGASNGTTPEQPLMVQPDAVTISTVHGSKGLEFTAVFLADVCARRFPSSRAKIATDLPFSGPILDDIDAEELSDNDNNDAERRLMYVALTRAERFLVVSYSGGQTSKFIKELRPIFKERGALVTDDADLLLNSIKRSPVKYKKDENISTSFSDLRYYLACPHDFYMRKVLGFSPAIDQAFGYGRGVHNLLRAIHSDPKKWASLAGSRKDLEAAASDLVDQGLFYLRYTTGDPAENMRRKGVRVVCDYVERFAEELSLLRFEPEKEFETLIELGDGYGGAMVSGAVDLVRLDDPPRVTLVDFKSGHPKSDQHQSLDEEEMKLQIGIYAVAAQKELEYEPERGYVRYLDSDPSRDEKAELDVPLDRKSVQEARSTVVYGARAIKERDFFKNPAKSSKDGGSRCRTCDFVGFCGMSAAKKAK